MDLPPLPIEILIHIACMSMETLSLMLSLSPVARFTRYNRNYIMNKFIRVKITNECTKYYIGNWLHRKGGPAVEFPNGIKYWYWEGKRGRDVNDHDDLPAIEGLNGSKVWYKEGKLHRSGGLPAVEWGNGDKEWWLDGKKIWYRHNKLHRDGGPAIEYPNGDKV